MGKDDDDAAMRAAIFGPGDPAADAAVLEQLTRRLFSIPDPEPDPEPEPEQRLFVKNEGKSPARPRGDADLYAFVNDLFGYPTT